LIHDITARQKLIAYWTIYQKQKKELGWQHICPFWDLVSEREHKNQYKAINND